MSNGALNAEDKYVHLHRGFEAIRESIQFLDTKTSIVIGLSSVAAGFSMTLGKWLFELPSANVASLPSTNTAHPYWVFLSGLLLVMSLVAFIASIVFSVWGVISRGVAPGSVTLLFSVPRQGTENLRSEIRRAIQSLSAASINAEYEDQLCRLGCIFERKHRLLQGATIRVAT